MKGLSKLCIWAQGIANKVMYDERGEVNIVATVVLIGIAVVLAIVFKDAIGNLVKTMLNTITDNAGNAIGTI